MSRGTVTKQTSPRTGAVTWRARWSYVDAAGVRRHRSESRPTRDEAQAVLTKALHELRSGTYVEASRLPFGEHVARWLVSMRAVWRRQSTEHNRIVSWQRWGAPALGSVPLKDVTLAKIQSVYDAMTARGLSGSTVRCLHDVVRMSLAAAVRQGLIARNPAVDVLLPAKARRIPKHWSGVDARRFLAAIGTEPDAAQWTTLLYTGMRVGELLALRWQDVDLIAGSARIVRTVTVDRDGREVIAEGAKSRASNRTVPLVGPCLTALKAHQAALKARRLKAGPAWVEHDIVFPGPLGAPLRRRSASSRFASLVERHGLPALSPHGLRHSCATLLLEDGVHPKIVSELLGHSSIAVTLDVYGHVGEGLKRAAAERLDAFLAGDGTTTSSRETG